MTFTFVNRIPEAFVSSRWLAYTVETAVLFLTLSCFFLINPAVVFIFLFKIGF